MPDRVPQPAKLTVDFSNVGDRTEGGRSAHVPEGDYLLAAVGYEIRKKKEENSQYISWKLSIVKPEKYKNAGTIYHITSLKEESLWSLRNFLDDLGIKVPKSTVGVPLKAIVDAKRIIGATLEDDEYNNKVKSKIVATFKKAEYEETEEASDETEEDEVEEAPTPISKKAKANPEPVEEDEDEDLEELELDDL